MKQPLHHKYAVPFKTDKLECRIWEMLSLATMHIYMFYENNLNIWFGIFDHPLYNPTCTQHYHSLQHQKNWPATT